MPLKEEMAGVKRRNDVLFKICNSLMGARQ